MARSSSNKSIHKQVFLNKKAQNTSKATAYYNTTPKQMLTEIGCRCVYTKSSVCLYCTCVCLSHNYVTVYTKICTYCICT